MEDIPIGALLGALVILILLSAFFSASETAMMALNRYRLKHLAGTGQRSARIAARLLDQPERLLGTILLGNNLVNNAAAAVATVIALKLYGEVAIAFATGLVTLVILVFAEVPPKTAAALYPERIAYPAAFILDILIRVAKPIVWLVNVAGAQVLSLLGIERDRRADTLSADELRTVVQEAGAMIPKSHRSMLLRILELEETTVDDIMVPRSAIEAIDLDADWDDIVAELATSHHTRLPVYRGSLDNIVGELHLRRVLHLSHSDEFNRRNLERLVREPYFIPEGSKLTQQLLALQAQRRQMGLVVDEYGDLMGLVTLDEILEEIVGEFTQQLPGISEAVAPQADGSFLVDAGMTVRDLNRKTGWRLPTDGPKTLNDLILEYLEDIPEAGTSLLLAGYPVEIVQTRGTAVTVARIQPRAARRAVATGA